MVFALTDRDKLKYMLQCISLAKKTSPEMKRPHVGTLVLSIEGKIVGEGYKTFEEGSDDILDRKMLIHAERNALDQAVYETEGSTLFTTLEPCVCSSDHGKKSLLKSCAELIVECGVAKVIYGLYDKSLCFDFLNGVDYLMNNGVEVEFFDRLEDRIVLLMGSHYRRKYYEAKD